MVKLQKPVERAAAIGCQTRGIVHAAARSASLVSCLFAFLGLCATALHPRLYVRHPLRGLKTDHCQLRLKLIIANGELKTDH